ncbi:MAG: TlpA family protein disulfide reductase [Candidatus Krumholzibacteriia bacterium]
MDCFSGSVSATQRFIDATGITFPVLRQGGYLQSSAYYGIPYDNYIVIDAEGIIRYTSVGEVYTPTVGRFNEANLRAAITDNLPVGVEGRGWSAVKALYAAPGPLPGPEP